MNIYEEFKNPPACFRGKPFWAWNGKLKKDELLRQINIMKEMGFGGYFMHSRTGLKTEYLSDEWFELINACADEGRKLKMESWLYDEDRWPSGTAGGKVTSDPKYRMKFLDLDILDVKNYKKSDNVIAVFTADVNGWNVENYKKVLTDIKKESYNDKKLLVFSKRKMAKSTFYNGYTYLDTLNKEATEEFLKVTHEKYKEKCGNRLGKSIKGIFTDEPHRGQLMSNFGSETVRKIKSVTCLPWTETIQKTFKDTFGYDLIEKLPELFLRYKGEKVSKVKWHYVELLQQMFINNFIKPINIWCKQNNIKLTGHGLHEDSLSAQTAVTGSIMRIYEHMSYPGVDVLTGHNRNYRIIKQLSSVGRQLGKKHLLSELYGCTGWQFTFEDHKNTGDFQALFGINLRCHHLSWYTMKGQAKRDYPASILHQSPWWNEYKYVEDYFSRINVISSKGKRVCNTLVINPVESLWCQIYPDWCEGLSAKDPGIKKLEDKYAKLSNWLTGAHIDFDYADENLAARHYRIKKDKNKNAVLYIGKAKYKQVIVSGMVTIRSTTLDILDEFTKAGGKVIFTEQLPEYVNAEKSDRIAKYSKNCITVDFNKGDIIKAAKLKTTVEIKNSDGTDCEEVFVQVRNDDKRKYIMMLNSSSTRQDVFVKFYGKGYIQKWDCQNAKRFLIGKLDEKFEYKADFVPGEEKVFVITDKSEALPVKPKYDKTKQTFTLDGDFEYELDEPNICVLDMAKYSIDDGNWSNHQEILQCDKQLREYFRLPYRSGHMLQPWFASKKGYENKGKVSLAFDFNVDIIPEDNLYLVVENPENYKISVNGKTINNKKPDAQNHKWVDICFTKLPLSKDIFKKGKNTIIMETQFNARTELEAIYLIGDFGVNITGYKKTLTALPEKLTIGDITKQKLPFYSGRITYNMKLDYKPKKDEKVFISLDNFEAACVKVLCEDKKERMIAWRPYEADITEGLKRGNQIKIQTVLTRRNTFGPLHQIPVKAHAYGPNNFQTKGKNFSKDYKLLETGLLSKIRIEIKKE